jgi:hypothetical protein
MQTFCEGFYVVPSSYIHPNNFTAKNYFAIPNVLHLGNVRLSYTLLRSWYSDLLDAGG